LCLISSPQASNTEARERRIFLHAKQQKAKKKVWVKPLQELKSSSNIRKSIIDIPSLFKSDEESAFLTKVLKGNFVFADLSDEEISRLVDAFEKETVEPDAIIIQQGDTVCDYFYILQRGMVKFIIDNEEVMRLDEEGSSFGELELLYDFPRAATCQAVQESVLWKVNQTTFRVILSRYAEEQEQSATDLRRCSPLFRHADSETLLHLAECFTTVKFHQDDVIIGKGDLAEVFYIIQEGTVRLSDIGSGTSPMMDLTLSEGDWFGELELTTGEPRRANITAATQRVVTLAMSKDDFESLLGPLLQDLLDRESRKRFIKALPIFANSNSAFSDSEIYLLVDRLKEVSFAAEEVVVDGSREGEKPRLWIVREGNVDLFDGHSTHHLQRGDYFGDKWINEASRRPDHSSISSKTAKATCVEDTSFFVLDSDDIGEVIGDITRLGAALPYVYPGLDSGMHLEDIQKHRVLGKGRSPLN
jgi:cAMP-dependent protein kinase regulator